MTNSLRCPRSKFEGEDSRSLWEEAHYRKEVSWAQCQGLSLCWEVLIWGKVLSAEAATCPRETPLKKMATNMSLERAVIFVKML